MKSSTNCGHKSQLCTHDTIEKSFLRMPPQSIGLSNWSDRIRHARYWRNEVKKSLGEPLNNLQVVSNSDGDFVMALGNLPGDSNSQTLMTAKIPLHSEAQTTTTLELQPLTMLDAQESKSNEPSAEIALFYERLRGQVVNGISGYSLHNTGAILLSSFSKLQIYKRGNLATVAEWFNGTILNANFSMVSAEYISFCSNGQLYVDRSNQKVFASVFCPGITNGVASFIAQEELERFDGYWWSPQRLELLYERVDETKVTKLAFECPGKPPSTEPIHYPLVGTENARSTLRMVVFDSSNNTSTDKRLAFDLNDHVPWQEYLVRAGWTDDGNNVYAQFMDRLQNKMAILLISREAFVSDEEIVSKDSNSLIRVVYQEDSTIWLNSHNLTRFIKPTINSNVLPFIYGSEKHSQCHLFLRNYVLASSMDSTSEDIHLTTGDWSVIKDGPLVVDTSRELIYFLANRVSPLIISLCVTSYKRLTECRVLTPDDLCYKFERGQSSLNINPEIGFVCWLSSITNLPECRFYRLVHNSAFDLPEAVFQYNVNVKDSAITPESPLQPSVSLTNLFRSRFFEYRSQNSGEMHYALLLWPNDIWTYDRKYPLILHVYAGPGVQLVRNNWQIVAQFLKFITAGYAVLIIDGRGSSNRGLNFESHIKDRMGSVEVSDQVEGLLYVARESQLIDLSRVGCSGWSYGGYMALLLIINHPEIFRASCAGGAVVDWTLYDTCYTERYMSTVEKNSTGYKESCILGRIGKLPDEEGRLLVVHGLIDENVHFAHTEKLINSLITAGKPFQQLIFPSERHGVRNAEAVEFFHASMISFFEKALR
uniref:Dipeptidyl peptidase 9 n=1 Tax=Acrobeloides nanus TaxID=290746 RepID=A0A914BVD4_9BILA